MQKILARGFVILSLGFTGSFLLSSCAVSNTSHCPGVSSTGNYAATHKAPRCAKRSGACAGTTSTGTIKPKVSRKKEDGLYSPKMLKAMEKAKKESGNTSAQ